MGTEGSVHSNILETEEEKGNESQHTVSVLLQYNPLHPAVCKEPGWPMLCTKHQPPAGPWGRIASLWAKRLWAHVPSPGWAVLAQQDSAPSADLRETSSQIRGR